MRQLNRRYIDGVSLSRPDRDQLALFGAVIESRRPRDEPIKNLVGYVVRDALRILVNKKDPVKLVEEVAFFESDSEAAFSFRWCCGVLGISWSAARVVMRPTLDRIKLTIRDDPKVQAWLEVNKVTLREVSSDQPEAPAEELHNRIASAEARVYHRPLAQSDASLEV